MGFGLLVLGYLTVLGVMPTLFVYNSFAVLIPICGGGIMFAAFRKLQAYNIYFKVMKYICGVYILLLLGLAPFEIIYFRQEIPEIYMYISKISRILVLFIFHYFLLNAMNSLAKEINNPIVKRASQRNIYATYFCFGVSVLPLFPIFGIYAVYLQAFSIAFSVVYYFLVLVNIFSCYMRITTE